MIKTASDAILNGPSGAVSACVLLCIREAALHFDPAKGIDDKAGEDHDRNEGTNEADHGVERPSPAERIAV